VQTVDKLTHFIYKFVYLFLISFCRQPALFGAKKKNNFFILFQFKVFIYIFSIADGGCARLLGRIGVVSTIRT